MANRSSGKHFVETERISMFRDFQWVGVNKTRHHRRALEDGREGSDPARFSLQGQDKVAGWRKWTSRRVHVRAGQVLLTPESQSGFGEGCCRPVEDGKS